MLYRYEVIALPPLLPGVKAIDAVVEPTCTEVMVGAPGSATGVWLTELDAAAGSDAVDRLDLHRVGGPVGQTRDGQWAGGRRARVPRPGTVELVEVAGDRLRWMLGGVKLTWRAPSSGVIEVMVGDPGGPEGVKVPVGDGEGPVPMAFTASTSKM